MTNNATETGDAAMRLQYYNQLSGNSWDVEVKPIKGLAEAYESGDGQQYRLLPSGRVLNGYFGVEIGISGSIRDE